MLIQNSADTVTVLDEVSPLPGQGFYYLARSAEHCNARAGGSWGGAARDAQIATEGNACAH